MQDDDHMRAHDWLSRALELFESHPSMALLGGRAGRLDTGDKLEVKGARLNVPGWVLPLSTAVCLPVRVGSRSRALKGGTRKEPMSDKRSS